MNMMGMNPMDGNMNQNMMMNNGMMGNMGMDPNMLMMLMMNNQMNAGNGIDDPVGWNLLFEYSWEKKSYIIRINEQKFVREAITKFRLKSSVTEKCKFVYNNKQLFEEMKICESGLQDYSKISVISLRSLEGA